jgi:hypothetical protein
MPSASSTTERTASTRWPNRTSWDRACLARLEDIRLRRNPTLRRRRELRVGAGSFLRAAVPALRGLERETRLAESLGLGDLVSPEADRKATRAAVHLRSGSRLAGATVIRLGWGVPGLWHRGPPVRRRNRRRLDVASHGRLELALLPDIRVAKTSREP